VNTIEELTILSCLADRVSHRIAELRSELTAAAIERYEQTGAASTDRYPQATVALRVSTRRATVTDRAALIAWATTNRPDMLRTIVDIHDMSVKALLAAADITGDVVCTTDGTVIDGITIHEGGKPTSLAVKFTDTTAADAEAEAMLTAMLAALTEPIDPS